MDELQRHRHARLSTPASSSHLTDWATIKSEVKGDLSAFLYKKTKRNPDDPAGHHGSVNESPRWS